MNQSAPATNTSQTFLQGSQPLISVIMATYDEPAAFLKKSIESILGQTYSNIEIIVCVDNPENKEALSYFSKELAENFKIKVIVNEVNIGLGYSLNKCLDIASGEYVARMDADDYSFPERLSKQLSKLKALPDNSVLFTEVVMCDRFERIVSRNFPENASFKNNFFLDDAFVHATYMTRKSLINKYKYGISHSPEDYEMYIRMIADGCRFYLLNERLYKYNFNSKVDWRDIGSRARRTNKTARIMLPILIREYRRLSHCRGYYRSVIKYLTMCTLSSTPLIYAFFSTAYSFVRKK